MKFKEKIDSQIYSILINEWDPIGIKDIPEAQDEYLNYLPNIKKFFLNKEFSKIEDYLMLVEVDLIGLSEADQKNIQRVARLLEKLNT